MHTPPLTRAEAALEGSDGQGQGAGKAGLQARVLLRELRCEHRLGDEWGGRGGGVAEAIHLHHRHRLALREHEEEVAALSRYCGGVDLPACESTGCGWDERSRGEKHALI